MAMATGGCCGLIWSGFLGGSGLQQQQQLWASVRATPPKRPSPASGFLTVEATKSTRREHRTARHARIRKKVEGTPDRPRLCVFRSNKHLNVQVIDDTKMHTLASSTMQKPVSKVFDYASGPTIEVAKKVGESCLEKGITKVTKNASSLQDEDDFGETLETEAGKDNIHVKDVDNKMSQGNEIMPDKPIKPCSKIGSRGWGKGVIKTTLQPHRRKFFAENDFFSRKSFRDLGCTEFMIESLEGQLFFHPSHIQAMAFEPIIEGRSCVVADQSGSGKTLAYLTPLIQRLRQEELQGLGESLLQNPQVLIMVPTAELASQVLNNCRLMSKFGVPFRSMVATGGCRQRTQLENLEQGVDVLIATPGRFKFLMEEGFLKLQNLKCVVLDEVDILFNDEDFEIALQGLIYSSPVTTQFLFVTATLPVDIYNKLIEVFPDCEVIMGPGMHRTSARLEEILVDCSGENEIEKTPETAFLNKKSALLQLVEQSPVSKTIIFCNKIETCRKVENVLKRIDRIGTCVRVLPFHAAVARELRLENMGDFMNPSQSEEESLFLVCTDRASRGIDFTGVDHVVLFDFPRDPSEYVRRVGRTARGATGQGKAFIFTVGKQVSLAKKIIERNRKGHPLHDVPSAYEQMRVKNIA